MRDAPDDPDARTEWAEQRTDWAEDRTVLANERTFAGWMRTALAAVVVALGLHAVFREIQPTWAAKAAASLFIAAALIVIWAAERAAARTAKRMDNHQIRTLTHWRLTLIAALLTLGSVGTGAILWML